MKKKLIVFIGLLIVTIGLLWLSDSSINIGIEAVCMLTGLVTLVGTLCVGGWMIVDYLGINFKSY